MENEVYLDLREEETESEDAAAVFTSDGTLTDEELILVDETSLHINIKGIKRLIEENHQLRDRLNTILELAREDLPL